MDLVTGMPRTTKGFDSIWVIVDRLTKIADRLTKTAHFLHVRMTYTVAQYAKLYLDRIVLMHGVPISIVSDKGT